jgi:hypothetical protein
MLAGICFDYATDLKTSRFVKEVFGTIGKCDHRNVTETAA